MGAHAVGARATPQVTKTVTISWRGLAGIHRRVTCRHYLGRHFSGVTSWKPASWAWSRPPVAAALWVVARRTAQAAAVTRQTPRTCRTPPHGATAGRGWCRQYATTKTQFLSVPDAAPAEVVARRRVAFGETAPVVSANAISPGPVPRCVTWHQRWHDLDFTSRYRVPFPFSAWLREQLPQATHAGRVPGSLAHRPWMVTAAWTSPARTAVNLLGNEFYKGCTQSAVRSWLPSSDRCWGRCTPVVQYNVWRLRQDFGPRCGVLPHVGHRGGHAGGAAGALPTRGRRKLVRFCRRPITAGGAMCSRASAIRRPETDTLHVCRNMNPAVAA